MYKYVIDSTESCNVTVMKKHSIGGIIRYVAGGGSWKRITKSEAAYYRKSAIDIGYCYEAGAGWMLNGEGGPAVKASLAAIKALGGPSDCFVWLAHDTERNVWSALEKCMASGAKAHPRGKAGVGIYGSYEVCKHFEKLGYKTWQTVAWSYKKHDAAAALYQHAGEPLGNLGFDYDLNDVLNQDWGQEKPPAPAKPKPVPKPKPKPAPKKQLVAGKGGDVKLLSINRARTVAHIAWSTHKVYIAAKGAVPKGAVKGKTFTLLAARVCFEDAHLSVKTTV